MNPQTFKAWTAGVALALLSLASSLALATDPLPVISAMSPASGPVGTQIKLTGSGFTGAISATVGGVTDPRLIIASDTVAYVTVPPSPNGAAAVALANPTHSVQAATKFTVTGAAPMPVITSISPTSGPVGTLITITGKNLAGVTMADIGTVAGQVTGDYPTSLELVVPSTASVGKQAVMIRTAGGAVTSGTSFQVTNNPPSILNNTAHATGDALLAVEALGLAASGTVGPSGTTLAVNQTCAGATCSTFDSIGQAITQATTVGATNYAADASTAVTGTVPYQVINQSSTGYEAVNDTFLYGRTGLVYAFAYCGTPTAHDQPPAAFVTVLPNYSGAWSGPGTQNQCGYANGLEFSIPASVVPCPTACTWTPIKGGKALDVSTPTATTEAMSGVLAALKHNHPQWTWGDVKSVLRTTASNWSTGYAPHNATGPALGYGNINYATANAYTGTIFLQPPNLSATVYPAGLGVSLQLVPFNSSRRAGEIVYVFSKKPVLPAASSNNEYTYAQIQSLATTYGGSVFWSSTGLPDDLSYVGFHATVAGKPVYFVAFTVDSLPDYTKAHFSRAESYSILGPF